MSSGGAGYPSCPSNTEIAPASLSTAGRIVKSLKSLNLPPRSISQSLNLSISQSLNPSSNFETTESQEQMTKKVNETIDRRAFVVRSGQVGFALSLFPTEILGRLRDSARALHPEMASAPSELAAFASSLRWRNLGPFRGGRVAAATGVPGRVNEFYFGAVNGGVWKTYDGGRVWQPVFDSQPMASIGAIAVAPSAPDTVYVGSGESTLRDSVGYGDGVYKSLDGGKTWSHVGLTDTQHIGKIAIDPRNPDIVFEIGRAHV